MQEHSSRWNELDYYKEGQKLYGRDNEINTVSNGIIKNLQTIIYGQSGVGKSSLLFAGIFPNLRKKNFFPVFIRLGTIEQTNYTQVIKERVIEDSAKEMKDLGKPALKCTSIKEDESFMQNKNDLWYFFHTTRFTDYNNNIFIPVLVFDQFEEIINDRIKYSSARDMLLELYALLDNSRIVPDEFIQYSNYRIVISLREDYLYCLEELIDKYNLSELRHNRFRIKWMNETNARTVITKTFDESIESDTDRICDAIIKKATNESGDISTICLSLVCSIIDIKSQGRRIKYTDLNDIDKDIYKYYNQKLSGISYKAKKYLEKHLITPDGRRNSLDYNEAKKSGMITTEELDLLISQRMIRRVSMTGNNRIEYIHDIIPKLITNNKHNWLYYIKKTFKERHNITGVATKSEVAVSNLFLTIIMLLSIESLAIIIPLSIHNETILYDILLLLFGAAMLFCLKLSASLSIRWAHNLGASGFDLFKFKMVKNYESALTSYTPKTSYYYTGLSTGFDNLFMRYGSNSQVFNKSINRYEFLAVVFKCIKHLAWCALFLLIGLLRENQVFMFIAYFVLYKAILTITYPFFKRINNLNINPYYGLIPLYNLYLFVKCFQKDKKGTTEYSTKTHYIWVPEIIIGLVCYVIFFAYMFMKLFPLIKQFTEMVLNCSQ